MTFGELPIGAEFRVYGRGAVRTKTAADRYDAATTPTRPDVEVIPERAATNGAKMRTASTDATRPWGPAGPLVIIRSRDEVQLEGVFAPWQLAAVQEKLRGGR